MRIVPAIIPADPDERMSWFYSAITATHWVIEREPITELSLAENFAYFHQGGPDRIRYVASSDRWIVDVRGVELHTHGWQFDNSRIVHWLASRFLAQAARDYNNSKTARYICTAKMRNVIIDLARDAPCLTASYDLAEALAEALAHESKNAAAE
jgi:hypothetical protein